MTPLGRVRAGFGIALAQLGHYRVRTVLLVLAISLAVLSTTLLASVGVGVVETGTQMFDDAGRDLWVSGGPSRIGPGGLENGITDAHRVAAEMKARDGVLNAEPIAYQSVYVGTDPGDLHNVVGVGITGGGGESVSITAGRSFEGGVDPHYADGTYDGPMTREVVVGPRLAAQFDLEPGDALHVGGTVASARENRFTVIGVSPTFSRFLGAPTAFLLLSELQEVSGTTGSDRAAQIIVTLQPGTDVEAAEREFERAYPEYEIRTNQEQLQAVLQGQALVLASAGVLVVLAVLAGIALTVNVMALLVHHQRRALAVLKAGGVSSRTLGWVVIWQAVLVGVVGAGLGLALTPVGVAGLNWLAELVVGFEDLVRTPRWVYLVGGGLALGIGLLGAAVGAWRVRAIRPLVELRG